MASVDSLSPLINFTIIGDGLEFNTWGDTLNANETIIENAIAGIGIIPVAGNATLTIKQVSFAVLAFTGALTGNTVLTLPSVSRQFIASNQTTGPFTLSLQAGASVPIVIPPATVQAHHYYTDGQNIIDTSSISAALAAYLPPGFIGPWCSTVAPSGWLLCDGTAYLIATYPALAAAMGTSGTDGVSWNQTATPPVGSFHVPDLRAVGIRGFDAGKGVDAGRVFATYQADMFASHTHIQNAHVHLTTEIGHTHVYNNPSGASSFAAGGTFALNSTAPTGTGPTSTGLTINNATAVNQSTGGIETVGKNIAAPFIIRT